MNVWRVPKRVYVWKPEWICESCSSQVSVVLLPLNSHLSFVFFFTARGALLKPSTFVRALWKEQLRNIHQEQAFCIRPTGRRPRGEPRTHILSVTPQDALEKSWRTRLQGEGCQGYSASPAAALRRTCFYLLRIMRSCLYGFFLLVHHNTTVEKHPRLHLHSLRGLRLPLLCPSCSFSCLFTSLLLFWRVSFARQPSSLLKGFSYSSDSLQAPLAVSETLRAPHPTVLIYSACSIIISSRCPPPLLSHSHPLHSW